MTRQIPNDGSFAVLRSRPAGPAVMLQSWRRLLFLHWRFEPGIVQSLLPPGLTVETWDDAAWVGLVPFEMRKIRPTRWPSVPYLSNFLELNVRTYAVNEQGTPGVWFISLSADRLAAVVIARNLFQLPYHWSKMSCRTDQEGMIRYTCRRFSDRRRRTSRIAYRPLEVVAPAVPGALDGFLIERYVLFSRLANETIVTGGVHHAPYQIQPVELVDCDTRMFEVDGLASPGRPPEHAVWSAGVDVEVFGLGERGEERTRPWTT